MMRNGRFIHKNGTQTVEAADPKTGLIAAVGDTQIVDVQDMTHISVYLNQIVDNGTVVLVLEKSADGITWQTVDASTTEEAFEAGANTSVEFTLSDGNGMYLRTKQIRARCTAIGGTGRYTLSVSGEQAEGYR
jgi:hypothetical protein